MLKLPDYVDRSPQNALVFWMYHRRRWLDKGWLPAWRQLWLKLKNEWTLQQIKGGS